MSRFRKLAGWAVGLGLMLAPLPASAQVIQEILDSTGAGPGNPLDGPWGLAMDSAGVLYVSGDMSDNVFAYHPDGSLQVVLDSTGDGIGNTLDFPTVVVVGPSDELYVAGTLSDNVFRVSPSGVVTEILDQSGDGMGNTVALPVGIVVDPRGNVYVATRDSDRVFRVTPAGAVSVVLDATGDGTNALDGPNDMVIDPQGNIYVGGFHSDNVFRITPSGQVTEVLDSTGDGTNPLDTPWGMAIGPAGDLYVTGWNSHNVFRVGSSITQIIDGNGDGLGNNCRRPQGLAFDDTGRLFIATYRSDNVLAMETDGTVRKVLDSSGDGANTFDKSPRVLVDREGRIYATGIDSDNVFRIDEIGLSSCFGRSGCPCANDDPTGEGGCLTSTGSGAKLGATGSRKVYANDLALVVSPVPSPDAHGLIFMGPNTLSPFSPASTDGFACTGGALRLPAILDDNLAPNELVQPMVIGTARSMGVAIAPGSTWHFQAWFRDLQGSPCGGIQNLSNVFTVTFTP